MRINRAYLAQVVLLACCCVVGLEVHAQTGVPSNAGAAEVVALPQGANVGAVADWLQQFKLGVESLYQSRVAEPWKQGQTKASEAYATGIETLLENATRLRDLQSVVVLKQEQERFVSSGGSVPSESENTSVTAINSARQSYRQRISQLGMERTQAARKLQAECDKELVRVAQGLVQAKRGGTRRCW
jgi:hypothetical protein